MFCIKFFFAHSTQSVGVFGEVHRAHLWNDQYDQYLQGYSFLGMADDFIVK
jgi:hypothetical protein